MDLNLMVLAGHLTVNAEVRQFDSGGLMIRYLVTVSVDHPRHRVDVIPASLWDPSEELIESPGMKGDGIWLCGSLQRRYVESTYGRRSTLELVAEQVKVTEGVNV